MLSDEEYIAFCNAILLAFDREIDSGFFIPGECALEDKILSSLNKINLSNKLKNGFREIVFHYDDSRSSLSTFLFFTERLYCDWRYGYGTLYAWKPGEKEKALKKIKSVFSKKDIKQIEKFWDIIKINEDVDDLGRWVFFDYKRMVPKVNIEEASSVFI